MKKRTVFLSMLVLSVPLLEGCKNSKLSNQEKGAIIGIGTGAAAGAVIGKNSGNTAVGAIIGAAVGGTAGTLIGIYMDKQARELRKRWRMRRSSGSVKALSSLLIRGCFLVSIPIKFRTLPAKTWTTWPRS